MLNSKLTIMPILLNLTVYVCSFPVVEIGPLYMTEHEQSKENVIEHLFPIIPGMDALFGKPLFSLDSNVKPEIGFRRKSSIVIEGPPGSGKTAATLAICRALMPDPAKMLYYLSTEVTEERLFKNHSEFGWFAHFNDSQSDDSVFTSKNLFLAELPRSQTDRPLPSSTELINEIFRGISNSRSQEANRYRPSLIIVDSLSGLLRDASTPGERRRLTEDFLERLNSEFGEDLGLVFLITESSSGQSDETPLEQYVADYVFRLGYKELPGGRRIRTWDIVKSHGTYMAAGKHTWDFFTQATADTVFYNSDLKNYVWGFREKGQPSQVEGKTSEKKSPDGETEQEKNDVDTHVKGSEKQNSNSQNPATIVIYPQWSTYLAIPHQVGTHSNATSQKRIWSGTPGLDELLEGDTEYWSRPDKWFQKNIGAKWSPGLRPGETSLMLGSSGTGKTWLLIQFLLGNLHDDGEILNLADRFERMQQKESYRDCDTKSKRIIEAWKRTLLISFEGTPSSLRSHGQSSKFIQSMSRNSLCYFFPPSGLHLNRLLFELRWIVTNIPIERIAIDGLADFLKSVHSEQRPGIAAAIFRTLQHGIGVKGVTRRATVFATYELNPSNDFLAPDVEGVSAICENVVVLRQIRLNDQMHKAIYVLKAQSRRHDRQVRELKVNSRDTGNTPGVRVQSGFEGFSDILSDSPEKSRVALQLFRENEAEERFNKDLCRRLRSSFAFDVDLRTFTHSELAQFLDSARGILGQVPATDIKVITLDEWWLRDLQQAPQNEPSQERDAGPPPSPLLRVDGFFALKDMVPETTRLFPLQQQRSSSENQGLASEHWITEVEKGVRTTPRFYSLIPKKQITGDNLEDSEGPNKNTDYELGVGIDVELQTMPHYSDFGLFCLNKNVATDYLGLNDGQLNSRSQVMDFLPSLWALPTITNSKQRWFQPPSKGKEGTPANSYDTIVDLLFNATKHGNNPERGFAFDMSRGENAVCVLIELAWSFGVEEGFLSEAAINFVRDNGKLTKENQQAEALRSAFRLLQYLVFHGLMVQFPVAKKSIKALLSRQWYSTLNIAYDLDSERLTTSREKQQKSDVPVDQDLVPVPLFPVGMLPCDDEYGKQRLILSELVDIRKHLSGICNRVLAALEWVYRYRKDIARNDNKKSMTGRIRTGSAENIYETLKKVKEIQDEIKSLKTELKSLSNSKTISEITPESLSDICKQLNDLASHLSKQVLDSNSGLSGRQLRWEEWKKNKLLSLKDGVDKKQLKNTPKYQAKLKTLTKWVARHRPWAAAGMSMDNRDIRQMLLWFNKRIDLIRDEIKSSKKSKIPVSLHGFACSGSWMLGVLRNTHSPGLSWKLIEEMTSRETNRVRAKMGAGIPTRKDFYDFYGDTHVPRMPEGFELTWNEFLTLAGSKVRRRDRSVCSKVPLAQFSILLREEMIQCIDVAFQERVKIEAGGLNWNELPNHDALKRMNETIDESVQLLLHYIAVEQKKKIPKTQLDKNESSGIPSSDRCEMCPLNYQCDIEGLPENGLCGVGLEKI